MSGTCLVPKEYPLFNHYYYYHRVNMNLSFIVKFCLCLIVWLLAQLFGWKNVSLWISRESGKPNFNSIFGFREKREKTFFQGGHHPKNCRHDLLFMQSCQAKAFRQSRGIFFKGCTISAFLLASLLSPLSLSSQLRYIAHWSELVDSFQGQIIGGGDGGGVECGANWH